METKGEIDAAFDVAAHRIRDVSDIDTNTILLLYSLYKQATVGPCNIPKPGIFSFTARQKWEAWSALGSTSSIDAKIRYIDTVNALLCSTADSSSGSNKNNKKPVALGVSVSCLAKTEENLDDRDKTIFDWLKEGNVERVFSIIATKPTIINDPDEDGMNLLHWAADRGDELMIQLLLDNGASINILDADGQTALHYAYSCRHQACIKLLEERGADTSILDHEGLLPSDL